MSRGIKQDIVIRQGQDEEIAFVLYEVMPTITLTTGGMIINPGVLMDLNGVFFNCQFRATNADGLKVAEMPPDHWKIENREWENFGVLPTVVGTLSNAITSGITALSGVYDVEAMYDGLVKEVLYGNFTLAKEVTR